MKKPLPEYLPDLHGASIIDDRGREIPITETMIQSALQKLIQAWEQTRSTNSEERRLTGS